MKKPEITNNPAEYLTIISTLKKYVDSDKKLQFTVIPKIS